MASEQVWKCDLCGEFVHPDALRRLAVRKVSDRPEAADNVDVGPECQNRPLSDVLALAADKRRESGYVE